MHVRDNVTKAAVASTAKRLTAMCASIATMKKKEDNHAER